MYDHIVGEVIEKRPARVVIRAAGVGYELEVPTGASANVSVGETAHLFTILHVIDGNPTLLGFAARADRDLARRLLSVSGVGKAMSLAILSTYTPPEIAQAIIRGDLIALKRIKGVGAKTAERLCIELRDHVGKLDLGTATTAATLPETAEDAILALITLGYSSKEARSKTEKAHERAPDATTEDLIKAVLRG